MMPEGFQWESLSLEALQGEWTVDVTLRAADGEGRVATRDANGQPLAAVEVYVGVPFDAPANTFVRVGTTGADGRLALPFLAAGRYRLAMASAAVELAPLSSDLDSAAVDHAVVVGAAEHDVHPTSATTASRAVASSADVHDLGWFWNRWRRGDRAGRRVARAAAAPPSPAGVVAKRVTDTARVYASG